MPGAPPHVCAPPQNTRECHAQAQKRRPSVQTHPSSDNGNRVVNGGTNGMNGSGIECGGVRGCPSTAMATQLKFWIDKVNAATGRKVLTKVGRVDDLRCKLAAHYGLDLSMPVILNVPTAIGPASTLNIQNHQWDYLCDLGNEWDKCATIGRPFLLCQPSSAQSDSLCLLEEAVTLLDIAPSPFLTPVAFAPSTLAPIPTNDTIQALNYDTINYAHHPPIGDCSHPAGVGGQAILQACQAEFDALSRASSLREVIEQVEEGHVTVNWREWLYAQLMHEFAGDKVCFFDFFTRQPQDESGLSKGKHKVVEAIPRWDKDLRGERLRDVYRDDEGDFSEVKWQDHWGLMNSWEVWRAMGMERID
ncbi:hypothetical protein PAXINDRAFT_157260 [Paxillus involutus ATCC 200175]|uniref:Uncharacterized protein n=1 Tax=Paxillus involutus ATCC 200175 TaxID=664439 RepID=A0A0C9TV59_PAXIN|nr:hypothetical protein PAXINDRAFT_157260 [Paxillus involutus ATCC 200175]